jgi:flagellar basal-body rod protein FlgB
MAQELTIDAVRLALGMYQLRAKVASLNIASGSTQGARALRVDFAHAQAALDAAAAGRGDGLAAGIASLTSAHPAPTAEPIQLDDQVAEMTTAGTGYQTLADALSRHFGLMRLAATGRN